MSSSYLAVDERLLSAAQKSPAAFGRVLQRIARPLNSNLLRDFSNPKFHTIRSTSKLLREAEELLGQEAVAALLRRLGFEATDDEETLVFRSTLSVASAAERWISDMEKQLSGVTEADVGGAILERRTEDSVLHRKQEHDAAIQRLLRQHQEEVQTQRLLAKQAEEERRMAAALQANDFADAAALIDRARMTIHQTGRLRNASFAAKHFQLRKMTHGRAFVCSCPTPNLEAHWHMVQGNLLYAYLVHLTPAAEAVVHTGFEEAYQYNTMPGTVNFGKTLHTTTKRVDHETGALLAVTHHADKVAETCSYCGVPFRTLFL